MSGRKANPYRTTGKPEKLSEPVQSPPAPARFQSVLVRHHHQPGRTTMVGGRQMNTDEMEFGTEDDLPTNVARNLAAEPDVEPEPEYEMKAAASVSTDEQSSKPSTTARSFPDPEAQNQSRRRSTAQDLNNVTAVLVDEDEEERRIAERLEEERKDIPLAEPVKEVPWWKRQSTICAACVVLLVVIIVAIAVPLSRQDSGGGPPVEPTISPAPTALTVITLVIQLDDKPWETGWTLECDEGVIQDAPPGTYALLAGRPSFRMEYPAVVVAGSECQLTIVDTGGDGLNPGFYAIYNGDTTGDQSALITGGTVAGAESIISFTPGSTAPPSPTAAPSTAGPTASPALCTVCPDGTPVPFPDADAAGWGMTCVELDFLASITSNEAICRNMQDQAAFGCGCRNFCTTMCPDRVSDIADDKANETVFIRFDQQVTCQEVQTEIESGRSNSQDQCLSANFLGTDVCGCPELGGPFCRICENTTETSGSTNPTEDFLLTEVVPGVTCLDITGVAYTLKRNDPRTGFSQLCPACLSIGAYCGCEVPTNGRQFCRLCGESSSDLLPEPARLVESALFGYTTTCYDVEFRSNINDESTLPCDEFRNDAAEACCTPPATESP